MPEFQKYPSIPRYRKDISISEKIDGTNACVIVTEHDSRFLADSAHDKSIVVYDAFTPLAYQVTAQSRNRIITPDDDNHGFATWVYANARVLPYILGPGYHYGEWWGSGIQRGYGLTKGEKHFTVFNPARYALEGQDLVTAVPILYTGPSYIPGIGDAVEHTMAELKRTGSQVPFATGFDNPEGVVVYHTASRSLYKVTYEYDEGKWSRDQDGLD